MLGRSRVLPNKSISFSAQTIETFSANPGANSLSSYCRGRPCVILARQRILHRYCSIKIGSEFREIGKINQTLHSKRSSIDSWLLIQLSDIFVNSPCVCVQLLTSNFVSTRQVEGSKNMVDYKPFFAHGKARNVRCWICLCPFTT